MVVILEKMQAVLRSRGFVLGLVAVLLGTLYRGAMSCVMFLQADEEIFSYDAYYFVLGRPLEFLTGQIGAYIGYPFLLSIWFRIFGVSLGSARAFSVVCSAVMLIFVYLILKKVTGSVKPAFLGTLALAIMPFPLRYGHVVLSEPLAWALITPGIFFLVKGIMKGRWYNFLISGMFISSAFFVRRSALILLFVIFPALIWTNRDKMKRMFKEGFVFLGGFLAPFFIGIFGFIAYFGWDKLVDLRFTRIPNISSSGDVSFSGSGSFGNALFTLQPTSWVAAGPMMLLLAGCAVIFVSLFKDRWKAVYVGAFLWPAVIRVAFDQQISSLPMARIMVIPIVVLFLNRTYKTHHGFYLTLSILFGSTVAFSYVYLSGDIWNVIIYCAVGGMMLVYLSDRLESRVLSLIPLLGGMISLYFITFKEPQIARLVMFALPVIAVVYSMSLAVLKRSPKQAPLVLLGLALPMFFLTDGPSIFQMVAGSVFVIYAVSLFVIGENVKPWYIIRLISPILAFCAILFLPEGMPAWGLYLPILGMVMFMLSRYLQSKLVSRFAHLAPVTGGVLAFGLCFLSSRDIVLSGLAGVYVGITSVILVNLEVLSVIWKEKIGEKISVILLMLVIGYLAFYVYYIWTEIYMMEFLVQFGIIGGLLIYVMRDKHILSTMKRTSGGYRRLLRPVRIRRRSSAVIAVFLVLSVPFSVQAFLDDDWFMEEKMNKRPYMRTMVEISNWIGDHTDDDDKVLVWHCYAIQSERETVIAVSNAAVYNGRQVIVDMEDLHVDIFVRDWYTNHGLWERQPVFQEYILKNFVIDRVIDGNECWIRTSRSPS
ncbi:MAG: glycosyltransferase family 39 protein [Candidatus Thermoplasmatota archaeon]|nr:glycosyltransferase family 39 protein [Candidatus Thermoplasmatota archaeon]